MAFIWILRGTSIRSRTYFERLTPCHGQRSVEQFTRESVADDSAQLNVFHWHVVDSQSFPLEIEAFPELSQRGAYDTSSLYTVDDVKKIVQYAGEVCNPSIHIFRLRPDMTCEARHRRYDGGRHTGTYNCHRGKSSGTHCLCKQEALDDLCSW